MKTIVIRKEQKNTKIWMSKVSRIINRLYDVQYLHFGVLLQCAPPCSPKCKTDKTTQEIYDTSLSMSYRKDMFTCATKQNNRK